MTSGAGEGAQGARSFGTYAALAAVLAVLLIVAAVRLGVADAPLERDEGEYAYAGQLILRGAPPYLYAYNMKLPGTYYAYALILALLGESIFGIRLGLLSVNAATTLVLFAIARRLGGDFSAAIAGASFAILSVGWSVLGPFAHATHFLLLPALAGLLLLLAANAATRWPTYLLAGALLGLAVLMKQHALFFVLMALGFVAWSSRREGRPGRAALAGRLAALTGGSALPLALVCAVLLAQGAFGPFYQWTFLYAREYVSTRTLGEGVAVGLASAQWITQASRLLWFAGAVGLAVLWTRGRTPAERVFVIALGAASVLAILPGFYFREHYFVLALPPLALLVGVAFDVLRDRLGRLGLAPATATTASALLFAGIAAASLYGQREYLFERDPVATSRKFYGRNLFSETVEVARYLRERAGAEDRIAVLGSEPQIYFYSGLRSATGYIYTYPLMEPQKYASAMQEEMAAEIEEAHPKYLIYVHNHYSWLIQPSSEMGILEWLVAYTDACYEQTGIAEPLPGKESRYLWDEQAVGQSLEGGSGILVFRRKSEAPCNVPRRSTAAPPPFRAQS